MRLDQYSQPIFNETDLFEALYKGQTIPNHTFVEPGTEVGQLATISGLQFSDWNYDLIDLSVEGFDHAMQQDWFMPEEYKTMDIFAYVINCCPVENLERVAEELAAYEERNMVNLLRWLKYFVDTCTKENILWGLGRGSSVASYVLYLIGVHSIDSIKYNLDWQEFLR